MSTEFAFHDVSNEAIKRMTPSEALQKHLENAQLAHRVCVAKALKAEEPPVDKCALTWGEVLIRYQAWAEYRPPFQDSLAQKKYSKYWTKKRQAEDDNNPYKMVEGPVALTGTSIFSRQTVRQKAICGIMPQDMFPSAVPLSARLREKSRKRARGKRGRGLGLGVLQDNTLLHPQIVEEQPSWTMHTQIEPILMSNIIEPKVADIWLIDFLRRHFDSDQFPVSKNVKMEVFIRRPERYITDSEFVKEVLELDAYRELEVTHLLRAEARQRRAEAALLRTKGVTSLSQWGSFNAKNVVSDMTNGILNAALERVLAPLSLIPTRDASPLYEEILGATMMSMTLDDTGDVNVPEKKPDGWDIGETTWTAHEVLRALELQHMRWPMDNGMHHTDGKQLCCIRKENAKLWKTLQELLLDRKGCQFILTGPPGVGKTFLSGFFLHQLLSKDIKRTHQGKAVPITHILYVVRRSAFLFDKTSKKALRYNRKCLEELCDTYDVPSTLLMFDYSDHDSVFLLDDMAAIVFVSLEENKCGDLSKISGYRTLRVNSWTEDELRALASFFDLEWNAIASRIAETGAFPRSLFTSCTM